MTERAARGETRQDLLAAIEDYRLGHVHLVVPLRLLTHCVKRHGSDYIRGQAYLARTPTSWGCATPSNGPGSPPMAGVRRGWSAAAGDPAAGCRALA